MPFRITVTTQGFKQAYAHLDKVIDYVKQDSPKDITVAAFNAAGTIFEQNFDAEGRGFGLGGWDDLADSTVAERERKGFGGEHPILVRYGDLRVITATSLRTAGGSGTFSSTDSDGKTIRVELNIGNDGGYAQASGMKAWNQVPHGTAPARPFWFTTTTVKRAIRKRAVATLADNIERL